MVPDPHYYANVFVKFPFVASPQLSLKSLNNLDALHYERIFKFVNIENQESLAVVVRIEKV